MVGIADVIRKRAKVRDYYKDLRSDVRSQGLYAAMEARHKRKRVMKEERISSAIIERVRRFGRKKEQALDPEQGTPEDQTRTQEIPTGGLPPPEVRVVTRTRVQ